mmetsp:Transcript_2533/g.8666  ORF Transcript_2533/g.8666 Transcript_2533/m.8666 type:complete len:207 (-) Transcript_2533:656-1276(-)
MQCLANEARPRRSPTCQKVRARHHRQRQSHQSHRGHRGGRTFRGPPQSTQHTRSTCIANSDDCTCRRRRGRSRLLSRRTRCASCNTSAGRTETAARHRTALRGPGPPCVRVRRTTHTPCLACSQPTGHTRGRRRLLRSSPPRSQARTRCRRHGSRPQAPASSCAQPGGARRSCRQTTQSRSRACRTCARAPRRPLGRNGPWYRRRR